jgi:hypothetical protein
LNSSKPSPLALDSEKIPLPEDIPTGLTITFSWESIKAFISDTDASPVYNQSRFTYLEKT